MVFWLSCLERNRGGPFLAVWWSLVIVLHKRKVFCSFFFPLDHALLCICHQSEGQNTFFVMGRSLKSFVQRVCPMCMFQFTQGRATKHAFCILCQTSRCLFFVLFHSFLQLWFFFLWQRQNLVYILFLNMFKNIPCDFILSLWTLFSTMFVFA